MGNCMDTDNLSKKKRISHKKNRIAKDNPIQKIVESYSIDVIRNRWSADELKIIDHRVAEVCKKQTISEKEFQRLFSKLVQIYPQETRTHIYNLFTFKSQQTLTKEELIDALTLIRKTQSSKDISSMLFFVYARSNKKFMSKLELDKFEEENQKFVITNRLGINAYSTNQKQCIIAQSQISLSMEEPFPSIAQENKGNQKIPLNTINEEDFEKIFKKYDFKKYQDLFAWDLGAEQKQLIDNLRSKGGMMRKKGDKVFMVEYQWYLEWKSYVEEKYSCKIEVKDDKEQDFSYVTARRKSIAHQSPVKFKSFAPKRPAQINNQILKSLNQIENQLAQNLVQFSHYICVPTFVWHRLRAIYQGGPAFQRIFPQIYLNVIYRVYINEDAQFIPKKIEKIIDKENCRVVDFLTSRKTQKWICFFKFSGRYNWTELRELTVNVKDVLDHPRNYVIFVKEDQREHFISLYNINERKLKKTIQNRIKNYGSEIKIPIDGILQRGEVIEIISNECVSVEITDEKGNLYRKEVQIDEKLKSLNPNSLSEDAFLNQLAGLENIKNTCFINAVLQCLIRTPSFGGYLSKEQFEFKNQEEDLLLYQIYQIYIKTKEHNTEPIQMRKFKKVLDKLCPFFQGNNQHDAQQFLICLLERISEEIKIKQNQYGLRASQIKKEKQQNKSQSKVVKFFSGTIENKTQCLKCGNIGSRIEPFFTYSLSLPILKEAEYTYIFVPKCHKKQEASGARRYGISLSPKVSIDRFLEKVANRHKISQENMFAYTVFNSEWMSNLENQYKDREISYYLNYDAKIVCYEVESKESPTYYSFIHKDFDNKSIKIEFRQRIYSSLAKSFKSLFLPYVLEITHLMTWTDVEDQIYHMLRHFFNQDFAAQKQEYPKDPTLKLMESSTIITRTNGSNASESRHRKGSMEKEQLVFKNDKNEYTPNGNTPSGKTPNGKTPNGNTPNGQSNKIHKRLLPYRVRIISTQHRLDKYCAICREDLETDIFIHQTASSTNNFKKEKRKTCPGCSFEGVLFDDVDFRNKCDMMVIVADWEYAPSKFTINNDDSFEKCVQMTKNRKDILDDILEANFNNKERIELTCQRESCQYKEAQRREKIVNPPNILLLHLKRFTYEDDKLVKLNNNVVYPEILTLPNSNSKYQLYGTVVHYGSGAGGHYISFVKVYQQWYKCDDERVTRADSAQHINTSAYLLFYKKLDFEPALTVLSF